MLWTTSILALCAASSSTDSQSDQTGRECLRTSFEECSVGGHARLRSDVGTWTAAEGRLLIDGAHAKSGEHSLHLPGGDRNRVELEFPALGKATELSFWIERWTRHEPFAFSVEAFDGREWSEVYDGAGEVVIGGFRTHVRAALEPGVLSLRFSCSSPADTGVLIDDLELAPLRKMELMSVLVSQPTLPVLKGNRVNPILKVELETSGSLEPLVVEELAFSAEGTSNLDDFEQFEVFYGGADDWLENPTDESAFALARRVGEPLPAASGRMTCTGAQVLSAGKNVFWLSASPKDDAHLDGFVDASCLGVTLADDAELEVASGDPPTRQRLGVALRNAGDDGSAAYRIPGLVTTNAGTLIAVYDVRWDGWGDLPGNVDVGLSRSTDGGATWEPMRIVMDQGDDPAWGYDGVGDPAVLVDRITGAIFVIATWSHGNRAWHGSGPGLEPEETGQLMLVRSDDDGLTWGEARNLTSMLKRPEWSYLLQGPGRGITMGSGRLVFPAQFRVSPDKLRMPFSTVIVSDDHGESWSIGTGARANTTESAVVELLDGELMLNMRDNRGGSRSVYVSSDLGQSWREHSSSRGALPEPVCMASLIHVGFELGELADGRLLFSNPNVDGAPRRRMTIQASSDFGKSWSSENRVLLDEGPSAGYSCLTMIDADTVGILYEGSRSHLTFQRVPMHELFPQDQKKKR